jgi:hypothetical protein
MSYLLDMNRWMKMNRYEVFKRKLLIWNLCMVTSIFLVCAFAAYIMNSQGITFTDVWAVKYEYMDSKSSCDGIDLFFLNNNSSFRDDVRYLKDYMSAYYDKQSILETESSRDKILSFYDVLNHTAGVDCEDLSFMVMCIAKRYNETCEYYMFTGTHNYYSHRGVTCNYSGHWQEVI